MEAWSSYTRNLRLAPGVFRSAANARVRAREMRSERDDCGAADARAGGMRVEFHKDPADLPILKERWEQLGRRASDHDAPFFQSFAWNNHVAGIRLSSSPRDFRLLVASVWRGQELIGIWPLSLQRSAGLWLARSLDDPFGQFAGVVFKDAADIATAVAKIVDGLRRHADGMQIEAVIAGSRLHAALLQNGAKATPTQEAVYLDLRPFSSFEGVLQTVGSETRKTMRKRRNRLQRAHQMEHLVAASREDLAVVVKETFDGRLDWLKKNGRTSPAFRTEEFRRIVDGLIGAEGIELLATSVKIEKGPIATGWGFVHDGAYYDYMSAMDSDYNEFGPGKLKLALLLEECFRRGIKVFEMLAPAMDYKLEWSDARRKLETMSLSFSAKARLTTGATNWLVPTARRLSRLLPASLRRSLVGRLNRE